MFLLKVSLVISLCAHGLHLTNDVHISVRRPAKHAYKALLVQENFKRSGLFS